jgi:hypothetical protein
VITYGQAPQAIKYQAIARDNTGNPIVNQDIGIRISLLQGDREGAAVYSETQNLPTNSYGMINLEIGKGKALSGMITEINWKNGPFFLKLEMDITGGTNYQLMGTSELLSVPYALYAEHSGDEANRAGEWSNNGTNIYVSPTYAPNNVGIGTNSPAQKLHIYNGSGVANFLLEGTYAGGGTAGMSNFYLKNSSGGALFGFFFKKESGVTYVVQSAYDGSSWIPYNKLNYVTKELEYKEGLGDIKFSNTGTLIHNYPGTGNGLTAHGNTPVAVHYIQNDYAGDSWGLSAGMGSSSAGPSSYGVFGFNYGSGFGVYGRTYNTFGFGTCGVHMPSGNCGYIGLLNYGVLGYLYPVNAGQYAVMGYNSDGYSGSDYAFSYNDGGVQGCNYWGYPYTFGVAGYSYLYYNRSGGCFGAYEDGSLWGCMAYKSSSGNPWAGYFTTSIVTNGGGKAGETAINNGIGVWGDLFGAAITGGIYGTFTRGNHYALYSHGDVFKDGLDVHLQKNTEKTNTVLYTSVSTSVTIQTFGYGQLSGGKCSVDFDKAFRDVVSQETPVIVTVTPVNDCNGVHVTRVSSSGFSAEENNSGRSDVTFMFIAIGQRAGYEKPSLPEEVVQSDYIDKVEKSLVDDGSTKGDSPGLYYENGQLVNGIHPSTLPDPNKPRIDPKAPPKPEPVGIDRDNMRNGKAPETGQSTVNSPKSTVPVSGIPDKQ